MSDPYVYVFFLALVCVQGGQPWPQQKDHMMLRWPVYQPCSKILILGVHRDYMGSSDYTAARLCARSVGHHIRHCRGADEIQA